MYGLHVAISGRVSEVVVWGLGDWVKEGLDQFFAEKMRAFAEAMDRFYTWGIRMVLEVLQFALPDVSVFKSGPLAIFLGATYGLGGYLVSLMFTVAAVVTMVSLARRRESAILGAVVADAIHLLLFGVFFYPVYSLIVNGLRAAIGALIRVASSAGGNATTVDAMMGIMIPGNVAVKIIAGLINGAISIVILIEIAALVLWFLILLFTYPISRSLRAAGKFGLFQYQVNSAGVFAVPLSFLFMGLIMAIGLVAIQVADKILPGIGPLATPGISFICLLLILATPIITVWYTFNKARENIGSMDAKIEQGLKIDRMPTVDVNELKRDADQVRFARTRDFAREAAITARNSDAPMQDVVRLSKLTAQRTMATSPDPIIGTVGKVWTVADRLNAARKAARGGGN